MMKDEPLNLGLKKLFFCAVIFLASLWMTPPLYSQTTGGTSTSETSQIKKKIKKNKKDLAAIKEKLQHEKNLQIQAQIKEKKVLINLQKTDQALGRLRRE